MTMNGLGWLIYPPVDFALLWDGEQIFWRLNGESAWRILADGVAPPGFDEQFLDTAPPHVCDIRPVRFLEPGPDFGIVQIWPGVIAQTKPGYGLVIRSPINQATPGVQVLEGFVETDWWHGPLAVPVRLLKTDVPIVFTTTKPLLQVYAFPKDIVGTQSEQSVVHMGMEKMSVADWEAFDAALAPGNRRNEPGGYMKQLKLNRRSGLGAED
jgi:hypothetical protein